MLNKFNRDRSYFQTLRDNAIYIESYNIDNQYDSLIDYINNIVVPEINNIVDGVLPGILGSANTYITNVGDGTTQWLTIDKSINDYSLAFTKLIKANVGSILTTNGYGELTAIAATAPDQLLISQGNNSPVWRKIRTQNISDREITGIDIADHVIDREHLKDDVIVTTIGDAMIRGIDFIDQSITANKFLNSSITSDKLGISNIILPATINPSVIAGVIERKHIKNGTITPDKLAAHSVHSRLFNRVKCITRGKIAPSTIDESWLKNYNNKPENMFLSDNLAPNFKVTTPKLRTGTANNYYYLNLFAENFAPDVKAAFLIKDCKGQKP